MPRTGPEIADRVEAFGGGFQVAVGEGRPVGYREIGPRHFEGDQPHFRIARGDLGGGEIARRDIVVVPEIQINGLPARE